MARFLRGSLLFVLFLSVSGCAFLRHQPMTYLPDWISDSSIPFYNKVGLLLSDSEREVISGYAERSYWDLVECIGGSIDQEIGRKIRDVPIVLIPGKPIFILGKEKGGFTNLEFIFIRRDRISDRRSLLHERVHIYLFLAGKRFSGDPLHRDQLFKECEKVG